MMLYSIIYPKITEPKNDKILTALVITTRMGYCKKCQNTFFGKQFHRFNCKNRGQDMCKPVYKNHMSMCLLEDVTLLYWLVTYRNIKKLVSMYFFMNRTDLEFIVKMLIECTNVISSLN